MYKDKAKQAEASRRHYDINKDSIKLRAKQHSATYKNRNKKYVRDYLQSHPCTDCGIAEVVVLTFDHVKGHKIGNLSDMVKEFFIKAIITEIEKCEVRCYNCHMRIEHKRRLAKSTQ